MFNFYCLSVYERRHAAECLEMILNKVSPQASEFFKGEMTQVTKCPEGHIINEKTKPFWTLPLSLKENPDTTYSVQNSFEQKFQTKTYMGDNVSYCKECKKETGPTRESETVKAPQILTLLLERNDTETLLESHRCVDVSPELHLKSKTFKLYGMVNLICSLQGGQHTATILSDEDNTWYEFHDEQVKKVEEQPFATSRTYKYV
ncbi:ubiquitin carboxyl-terminal hydrolase 12A-like [Acanthopagrus schlegelii]